jgi:hypothetical protein
MARLQFVVDEHIKELLDAEAREKGTTISNIVRELVNGHYGINDSVSQQLSRKETDALIFAEIEHYVKSMSIGDEFDLLMASKTFAALPMVVNGKRNTHRANIGLKFLRAVGKPPFDNLEADNEKLSANDAKLYRKILAEDNS